MQRKPLQKNTWVKLPRDACYCITGDPIGEGGGSLIYPAVKMVWEDGVWVTSELNYALKECFPLSWDYSYVRSERGEIVPEELAECWREGSSSISYLENVKRMQLEEKQISGHIYRKGFRLTPIIAGGQRVELSFDYGQSFVEVKNTVTVMESLEQKGSSLRQLLYQKYKIGVAFQIISQVLKAVKEVHEAGYLHLDLQDGNIFIKGDIEEDSNGIFISLIDFGSARKRMEDGLCEVIADRTIFSSKGFSAPEMERKNDGSLRLGVEADLYSIGYLLLYLLKGRRVSPDTLYKNRDGIYLKERALRESGCPKHLVESVQRILERALENEPENRYHSCDEMLNDVSNVLEGIVMTRKDLKGVKYDAFICYKHGEIDSEMAKFIQEELEHFDYSISRGEKKRKIRKVFVDEGELASCDLENVVEDVLKDTGWLIVLCSKDTKNSIWVNDEIKTFLKYHNRSEILAIMTDGEPAEIFPDQLKKRGEDEGELLAADLRADSIKERKKKWRETECYKILAPMLGTSYDGLKQRRKNYWMKRMAVGSVMAACLLTAIVLYTMYQADRVQKQYAQTRRNQARYLSSISLDLMKSGDREKALLTALAIQPEKDEDGPVVPEQLYALNTALDSYQGREVKYSPAYVGEVDYGQDGEGFLSEDGKYYITYHQDTLSILSGDKGSLLWRVTLDDLNRKLEGDDGSYHEDEICCVFPYEEEKIAVGFNRAIAVLDLKKQKILYTFLLNDYLYLTQDSCDLKNGIFVCAGVYNVLYRYDMKSGKKLDRVDVNTKYSEKNPSYLIDSISLNENGDKAAVGFEYYYSYETYNELTSVEQWNRYIKERRSKRAKAGLCGLLIYDYAEKKIHKLSDISATEVKFVDEDRLVVTHEDELNQHVSEMGKEQHKSFFSAIYDTKSDQCIFRGDGLSSVNYRTGWTRSLVEYENKKVDAVFLWNLGEIGMVDLKTGKELLHFAFQSDVIGISLYDETRILVSLENGNIMLLSFGDGVFAKFKIMELDTSAYRYDYNAACNEVILTTSDQIIFCQCASDNGYKELSIAGTKQDGVEMRDIEYYTANGQSFRCVSYYHQEADYEGCCEFYLYQSSSDECIYSYHCEDVEDHVQNIGVGYAEGCFYLAFTEVKNDFNCYFNKINLTDGKRIICEDISSWLIEAEEEDASIYDWEWEYTYTEDMKTFHMKKRYPNHIVCFDISENHIVPKHEISLGEDTYMEQWATTKDGKYLVDLNGDGDLQWFVYDTEKQERILQKKVTSFKSNYDDIIVGKASNQIGIYDGESTIYLYNCESGEQTEINVGKNCDVEFFDKDQYLIISGEYDIKIYDIKEEKVVSAYAMPEKLKKYRARTIVTGNNKYFFALGYGYSMVMDFAVDDGIVYSPRYIFYVDSDYQIYLYADLNSRYLDLVGGEIFFKSKKENVAGYYAPIYEYSDLKKKALEVLEGKTLSEEDKLKYFVAEPAK